MSTRHTKAERELLERRRVGRQLSNVAFNLAGGVACSDRVRQTMRDLYLAWDAIDTTKPARPKARKAARKR